MMVPGGGGGTTRYLGKNGLLYKLFKGGSVIKASHSREAVMVTVSVTALSGLVKPILGDALLHFGRTSIICRLLTFQSVVL